MEAVPVVGLARVSITECKFIIYHIKGIAWPEFHRKSSRFLSSAKAAIEGGGPREAVKAP